MIEKEIHISSLVYFLDNDKIATNAFLAKLEKLGYETVGFSNVTALIEKLQQKLPSILIINIEMVNDDLRAALKSENKPMPIIFVAKTGDFTWRMQAVRLGGVAYLIKPFSVENLSHKIDYILRKQNVSTKVLIVMDEKDAVKWDASAFAAANIQTFIVKNVEEMDRGLHEFDPDLILLYSTIANCEGAELATFIRQQTAYQNLPVIYLFAEKDKAETFNYLKFGIDDVLPNTIPNESLIEMIKNRIDRYKSLSLLIMHDNLTGLYNHPFVLKQLEIELRKARRLHTPLSVVMINVDEFKRLNEKYGYQAGDQVLVSLSLVLTGRMRECDIIGRYQGEDFLIILPNTTKEIAQKVMDELRKQFMAINYSAGKQIFNASFSAGISFFPEFHDSTELVLAAESAVNLSKKNGRNQVQLAEHA